MEKDVKRQIAREQHGLVPREKALLAFYFGYLGGPTRPRTKPKQSACAYVKRMILTPSSLSKRNDDDDDDDDDDDKETSFDLVRQTDLARIRYIPSITDNRPEFTVPFLSYGGLGLSDTQESAIVRYFAYFPKVFPTSLHLTKSTKSVTGFISGKVKSGREKTDTTDVVRTKREAS